MKVNFLLHIETMYFSAARIEEGLSAKTISNEQ